MDRAEIEAASIDDDVRGLLLKMADKIDELKTELASIELSPPADTLTRAQIAFTAALYSKLAEQPDNAGIEGVFDALTEAVSGL